MHRALIRHRGRRGSRGFSLLETVLGIAILGVGVLFLVNTIIQSNHDADDEADAMVLHTLRANALLWARSNYTSIKTGTATTPMVVPAATLQAASPLPSHLVQNSWQHSFALVLQQPQANEYEGLLIATSGGSSINRDRLAFIAARMGPSAGYVDDSGKLARGAYGGWSLSLAPFISAGLSTAPGRSAIYVRFTERTLLNPNLHRSAQSVPGGNRMYSPLAMTTDTALTAATNDLFNVNTISPNRYSDEAITVQENAPCTQANAVAGWYAASRRLLVCSDTGGALLWRQYAAVPRTACASGTYVTTIGRTLRCAAP